MNTKPEQADNHMVIGNRDPKDERAIKACEIDAAWLRTDSQNALEDRTLTPDQLMLLGVLGAQVAWHKHSKIDYNKDSIVNAAMDLIASFDNEMAEHIRENEDDGREE